LQLYEENDEMIDDPGVWWVMPNWLHFLCDLFFVMLTDTLSEKQNCLR